jgi:hypothetical protein
VVDEQSWIFERSSERLEVRRGPGEDGPFLIIDGNHGPHTYHFRDLQALTAFQYDMESFLVRTGWTFVEFRPERRDGHDRRSWPRPTERRRWWTDGQGHSTARPRRQI